MAEVDGDVAHALTYATWRLIRKGVEGRDFWEGVVQAARADTAVVAFSNPSSRALSRDS